MTNSGTQSELADEYNVSITDGQVDQLIKLCRSENLAPTSLSRRWSPSRRLSKMAGAKETVNKFVILPRK